MNQTTIQNLPDVAIESLASHYHRYVKWTKSSSVPNFHGSITTFYGSMINPDDLVKVELCYSTTYNPLTSTK